jgi:hypothetical protein
MCRILSLAQDGDRVLRDRPRLREEALQPPRRPESGRAVRHPATFSANPLILRRGALARGVLVPAP